MQELISFASHLADEAGEVIARYFRKPFEIESKQDETPVTIADRTVEATLRKIIEAHRPEDGILGEEYGPKESRNGLTWVLDPIDGTKSFIIGRPTFGTLIALWQDDRPLLGIIDQAVLRERWVGTPEHTTFNGMKVQTRPCSGLKQAVASCNSPRQVPTLWPAFYEEFKTFVWGGDCYAYGMLANGWLDAVIETGMATYDYAALVPIIQGAGGWMADWEGKPLTLSSDGRTIAVGDITLKDEILDLASRA